MSFGLPKQFVTFALPLSMCMLVMASTISCSTNSSDSQMTLPPPLPDKTASKEASAQLAPQGKLVIPVGKYFQELRVIEKQDDGTVVEKSVLNVAFVPMTGEAQKK